MPTLATGNSHMLWSNHCQPPQPERVCNDRGFSLIEVMVVMVIIGMMTAATIVLIPSGDDEVFIAARKTAATLENIHRESVITGQTVGIAFRDGTLDVRVLGHDGWEQRLLEGAGDLAPFLQAARLDVSETGLPRGENAQQDTVSTESFRPSFWFLPTGEYLDFLIQHTDPEKPYAVVGMVGKPVSLVSGDEVPVLP